MARRTKLTPEVQKRFVEALKLGATHRIACQYCGIDPSTFYRWMQKERGVYRKFRDEVKEAEAVGSLGSLARINKSAKEGDWKAAAWLLERRYPSEYGRGRRERPGMPTPQEQAEIAEPPNITMEVMGATWIRSLQVAEKEYAEGQLSAADYLRAVTALSGLAGRAMEIASRQADVTEVPALEVSVSLDSPSMIESPDPGPEPGLCGDPIEVS